MCETLTTCQQQLAQAQALVDLWRMLAIGSGGVIAALFGWVMAAKRDHLKDLREAIAEYRRHAGGGS